MKLPGDYFMSELARASINCSWDSGNDTLVVSVLIDAH